MGSSMGVIKVRTLLLNIEDPIGQPEMEGQLINCGYEIVITPKYKYMCHLCCRSPVPVAVFPIHLSTSKTSQAQSDITHESIDDTFVNITINPDQVVDQNYIPRIVTHQSLIS